MMQLTVLVLYVHSLELVKEFYELLGFTMAQEKHGNGPTHYSTVLKEGIVLELYPAGTKPVSRNYLMFSEIDIASVKGKISERFPGNVIASRTTEKLLTVLDPSRNTIVLQAKQKTADYN